MTAFAQGYPHDLGYWLSALVPLFACFGWGLAAIAHGYRTDARKSRGPNSGVGEASLLGPRDGCRSIAIWPPHRGGSARYVTANQPRVEKQPQPSHSLKERT